MTIKLLNDGRKFFKNFLPVDYTFYCSKYSYTVVKRRPFVNLFLGLERYWYWVIGYWAIFADIG